ncbi:MAG TPA: hypothetical protein VK641_12425, partial [Terriglobales bacterium]|nr:hypothetical protein [Terriglobales bacterium]
MIQRKDSRFMEEFQWHRQEGLHTSVRVNANHAESFAAVRATGLARMASATADIWLDRAAIANLDPLIVLGDVSNDPGKLVSQNPRIGIRRMSAGKGMKIASA